MRFLRAIAAFVVFIGFSFEVPASTQNDVPLKNWLPALPSWSDNAAGQAKEKIQSMALPSTASHFIALSPCRVVETRGADGTYGGPMLTGGVARAFNITTGPCAGIPVAAAYSLNIAVTGSTPGSIQFLAAYPAGTARPLVATMNFDGGETTSNSALVPADAAGAIEIYVSTDSHVIIDINGYIKEGVVTSVTPGAGLAGGGTGSVSLSVANGGIGATQLGASAVTNGAIQDGAVTGAKIANSHVVRSLKGLTDAVDIVGVGNATVTVSGSTIQVGAATGVPSGTIILGDPNDTTIIAAGYTEEGFLENPWLATTTTGAPTARYNHTAIWSGTKMIVWGGLGATYENTGGQYDPASNSWSAIATTGAPSGRYYHTAFWTGTKMIVWGGADSAGRLNSGGQYDPSANSWIATTMTGAPTARTYHAAVWSGTKMIVWGGYDGADLNTGGQYDPATNTWSSTTTTGAPAARELHTAVWSGTKMIVWGGYGGGATNTGGQYDPASDSWSATSTVGAPSPRYWHTAVWSGTKMIIWGGGAYLNSGAQYDPAANTWSATSTIGAPSGRYDHTAVWNGTRMIVWGGFDGIAMDTGGYYNPATNSWSATPSTGAPSGRLKHTAVWNGSRMFVWGGFDPSGNLNTGGGLGRGLSLYRKN